jgi:hypothetical protein
MMCPFRSVTSARRVSVGTTEPYHQPWWTLGVR